MYNIIVRYPSSVRSVECKPIMHPFRLELYAPSMYLPDSYPDLILGQQSFINDIISLSFICRSNVIFHFHDQKLF